MGTPRIKKVGPLDQGNRVSDIVRSLDDSLDVLDNHEETLGKFMDKLVAYGMRRDFKYLKTVLDAPDNMVFKLIGGPLTENVYVTPPDLDTIMTYYDPLISTTFYMDDITTPEDLDATEKDWSEDTIDWRSISQDTPRDEYPDALQKRIETTAVDEHVDSPYVWMTHAHLTTIADLINHLDSGKRIPLD